MQRRSTQESGQRSHDGMRERGPDSVYSLTMIPLNICCNHLYFKAYSTTELLICNNNPLLLNIFFSTLFRRLWFTCIANFNGNKYYHEDSGDNTIAIQLRFRHRVTMGNEYKTILTRVLSDPISLKSCIYSFTTL